MLSVLLMRPEIKSVLVVCCFTDAFLYFASTSCELTLRETDAGNLHKRAGSLLSTSYDIVNSYSVSDSVE